MYIYVKELNNDSEIQFQKNIPEFLKKCIIRIIKVFNIIVVQKISNDDYLYIIPKLSNVKRIKKYILKSNAKKVILSKKVKKYLNIENEEKLPKYFIYNLLKYIKGIANIEIETQSIYVLTNIYNKENIETIKYLSKNVKSVNIVTNRIKDYNKLEEKMYAEGELISVTNNKRKSLKNAKCIVNLDLDSDELNKYNINRNSIIINCTEEKINKLKCFEGIIINNIQIKEEDNVFGKDFNYIDILNNYELKNKSYIDCINIVNLKSIKIINLLGNNGIISKKEILNMKNILTNI